MLQLDDILDLDLGSLARRDIGAGAKDIGGVLFQQACRLVSPNGGLVHRVGRAGPRAGVLPGMQFTCSVYDMRLDLGGSELQHAARRQLFASDYHP